MSCFYAVLTWVSIDMQQSFETFWRIIERLKANPSPVAQVDAAISCLMAWQVTDQGIDQGKE